MIHKAGFRRRNWGSTATELGLIGALVLVATLGILFFLGDGLKQAFGLIKSDMLAQVSNAKANGMTMELSESPNEQPSSILGDPIIEPVDPAPTVITAGSNGNEAHAEIYKDLQALIERSMQKGTMTEAQANLLSKLIKQIPLWLESKEAMYDAIFAHSKAYREAYGEAFDEDYELRRDAGGAYWEAYESTGGSYEAAEAAYRSVWSRGKDSYLNVLSIRYNPSNTESDKLQTTAAKSYTDYYKSILTFHVNKVAVDELFNAAEESGLTNDPEVMDLIRQAFGATYTGG